MVLSMSIQYVGHTAFISWLIPLVAGICDQNAGICADALIKGKRILVYLIASIHTRDAVVSVCLKAVALDSYPNQ